MKKEASSRKQPERQERQQESFFTDRLPFNFSKLGRYGYNYYIYAKVTKCEALAHKDFNAHILQKRHIPVPVCTI